MPKNVRDLGKLIVAKGFKNFPKVQQIAQSGHTGCAISGKHELWLEIAFNYCSSETE